MSSERGRRERVAPGRVPGAIAAVEPLLALGRGAVGPALLVDAACRALLDAVVAHRGRGIEAVGDVLRREVLDEARLDGVRGPDAGIAVGLELEPDGARLLALAIPPARRSGAGRGRDGGALPLGVH